MTCSGTGNDGGYTCRMCGGDGQVCPGCRGMRFVRRDLPIGHPEFGDAFRCAGCCEGNQINPVKEADSIRRYLARHEIGA